MAEAVYQQASQAGQQQADGAEGPDDDKGGPSGADDDVVDADFEEVKEDKK